jgi:hypothetical protein
LRTALSRRKKKPVVPAGSRSTAPGGGAGAPNDQPDSSRASAKTSWLARATHRSPQTGAQRPAKGPRLCLPVHRQSRANKLLRAAGNSVRPRVGRRTRLS